MWRNLIPVGLVNCKSKNTFTWDWRTDNSVSALTFWTEHTFPDQQLRGWSWSLPPPLLLMKWSHSRLQRDDTLSNAGAFHPSVSTSSSSTSDFVHVRLLSYLKHKAAPRFGWNISQKFKFSQYPALAASGTRCHCSCWGFFFFPQLSILMIAKRMNNSLKS